MANSASQCFRDACPVELRSPLLPGSTTRTPRSCETRRKSRSLGSRLTLAESSSSQRSTSTGKLEPVEPSLIQTGAQPVAQTNLRPAPLAGSVKNATARYDLPSPALAVRNLMDDTGHLLCGSRERPDLQVEQARIAHLCTLMSNMHHRRAGFPFGTLTDFASDGSGFPIFCLSPLAIHTRNILEDGRCSLIVQLPGWSGLANARVTIFGDVYQLPPEFQGHAKDVFNRKQAAELKEGWVMGNNLFFRMHRISDIYFVGGFGTVQWVDVAEYAATKPDSIVLDNPHRTLQELNDKHADALKKLMSWNNQPAEDAAFISIDRLGTDVRIRHGNEYSVERLGFDFHVNNLDDALSATSQLLSHGISPRMQRRSVPTAA